jgi:hypothetical protein
LQISIWIEMRVIVKAASRMASMEREPKTLSLHELNYARVRTHTISSFLY